MVHSRGGRLTPGALDSVVSTLTHGSHVDTAVEWLAKPLVGDATPLPSSFMTVSALSWVDRPCRGSLGFPATIPPPLHRFGVPCPCWLGCVCFQVMTSLALALRPSDAVQVLRVAQVRVRTAVDGGCVSFMMCRSTHRALCADHASG